MMNTEVLDPYFSILMCSNKINDYFYSAAQSVLQQTFTNFEFIIVLNGDSHLIEEYNQLGLNDSRIKLNYTKLCQLTFNLNVGINLSIGSYIVRMDSDDISCANRLEKLYESCIKFSPDVVGSFAHTINSQGERVSKMKCPTTNASIRFQLSFRNPIIHPSVAIKRSTLLSNAGYMGDILAEDYDLWIRLARNSYVKFMIIPECLLEYRVHIKQSRGNKISYASMSATVYREFLITSKPRYLFGFITRSFSFFLFKFVGKMK